VLSIACTSGSSGVGGKPWPISNRRTDVDQLDYEGGGLAQETNWWGAFVIGLAGTILVTGIAPVMVTSLGAASIPLIVVITIMGYLLCLLLAELSAMMPERTGGSPSYAYPAFRAKYPRIAPAL
jgi:amino acid transporter